LEICEKRDVKGLYQKARAGEIKDFTGIDAPFEAPNHPDIDVKTENLTIDEAASQIISFILPLISV
jgi:adenylylsulfate kinase